MHHLLPWDCCTHTLISHSHICICPFCHSLLLRHTPVGIYLWGSTCMCSRHVPWSYLLLPTYASNILQRSVVEHKSTPAACALLAFAYCVCCSWWRVVFLCSGTLEQCISFLLAASSYPTVCAFVAACLQLRRHFGWWYCWLYCTRVKPLGVAVFFVLDHPLANHTVWEVQGFSLSSTGFCFPKAFFRGFSRDFRSKGCACWQPSIPHTLPQHHSFRCCAGTVPHGIPPTSCLVVHASPCGVGMLLDHL